MKKGIALAMALTMIGGAGWTVSAAEAETGILNPPAVTEAKQPESTPRTSKPRKRPQLTEEQKAAIETRRQELDEKRTQEKAKWDALSDADKQAIYSLQKQQLQLEIQEINKYQELGLVDAEQAQRQVERLNKRIANIGVERKDAGRPERGEKDRAARKGRGGASSATASSLS